MPGVLTRRLRAEELPKSWQKELGVEARPGAQFELTLTEIGEVADERATHVKRLLDEIEPVERGRPAAELVREARAVESGQDG